MPTPPETERPVRIDTTAARAGSKDGVVRWVLLASLSLAIIALSVIWIAGALGEDAIESAGTHESRAREAQGAVR